MFFCWALQTKAIGAEEHIFSGSRKEWGKMHKTLLDLDRGEEAEIVSFEGGHMMGRRLENIGIRPGKNVSRISSQILGGPVIVSVEGRQAAMGRGMAARVKVKVKSKEEV